MTKIFGEICVLKPEDTRDVVEKLLKCGSTVVIRANGYDAGAPAIFAHAYDVIEFDDDDDDVDGGAHERYENILEGIGGFIIEAGKGHIDTQGLVAPPSELFSFAIDVFDDTTGIARRISCRQYSRERFVKIAIEAAGWLANTHGKSIGNALARRILRAALGPVEDGEAVFDPDDEVAAA